MKKIYLDHAATTPVDREVLKAMEPFYSDIFGNASSLHQFGQRAAEAVKDARKKIAKFLNCETDEIIFTSGATEADNLAVQGTVKDKSGAHIITTAIEHPAVLEVCKNLESKGVEVSYLKPQADGIIPADKIKEEIKDNTALISVMYVNNEIGTIQPIKEIGEIIKEVNKNRAINRQNKIIFHTDAVQAMNYCNMDVNELGVDLMSISGHKVYGPKGIGVLYLRKDTAIRPIQFGGHHEQGIRPGTLNTPAIVGIGKAVELISSRQNSKIEKLRNYLWQQIQNKISNVKLNGSLEKRVPNNLNISFEGVEGESLMLDLDIANIAVSTGSACSSGSLEPSHVLMAIGLSHEDAHGSLRITLGKDNTKEEIDFVIKKLSESVEKFRKMAPKN